MHSEKGQTTQDYLLGVTILLLTVFFVFGAVPTVFESYERPVGGTDRTQAHRAAEWLLHNYSVDGRTNVLRFDSDPSSSPDVKGGINETLSRPAGIEAFREGAGLNTRTDRRAKPHVNVILVNSSQLNATGAPAPIVGGNGEPFEYGENYRNQSAASVTRVVRLDNATNAPDPEKYCTPTCWLIVRVW